jgi:hypothetical protein
MLWSCSPWKGLRHDVSHVGEVLVVQAEHAPERLEHLG